MSSPIASCRPLGSTEVGAQCLVWLQHHIQSQWGIWRSWYGPGTSPAKDCIDLTSRGKPILASILFLKCFRYRQVAIFGSLAPSLCGLSLPLPERMQTGAFVLEAAFVLSVVTATDTPPHNKPPGVSLAGHPCRCAVRFLSSHMYCWCPLFPLLRVLHSSGCPRPDFTRSRWRLGLASGGSSPGL